MIWLKYCQCGVKHQSTNQSKMALYKVSMKCLPTSITSCSFDFGSLLTSSCKFYRSGSSWLKVTPWGLRKALNWIRNHYGNLPIYITENGISDKNGSLQDDHRIFYYKHYLNNVLKGEVFKIIIYMNNHCQF